MNCTICGFDNTADGRFCKKCGAALITPAVAALAPTAAAAAAAAALNANPSAVAQARDGIPTPYLIIAVVAAIILVVAWLGWRSIGGGAPRTAIEPSSALPGSTASAPANPEAAATSPPVASAPAGAPSTAPAADTSATVAEPSHGAPAGTSAAAEPPVPPPGAAVAPAPSAAHHKATRPTAKPKSAPPPASPPVVAQPAAPVTPAPPPVAARPAPRTDRWTQMGTDMARCDRENFLEKIICEQKVRVRYCDGYWGNVPQCPTGPAPTTGG